MLRGCIYENVLGIIPGQAKGPRSGGRHCVEGVYRGRRGWVTFESEFGHLVLLFFLLKQGS